MFTVTKTILTPFWKIERVAPARARGRGRGRGRGRKASRVIESDEEVSPEPLEAEELEATVEAKTPEEPTPAPVVPAEEKENDVHPPPSMFCSAAHCLRNMLNIFFAQIFSRHGSRHIAAGSTDFYDDKPRST